jgi:hypothetical protein
MTGQSHFFNSWLWHRPAVWPSAKTLTTFCSSSLNHKMRELSWRRHQCPCLHEQPCHDSVPGKENLGWHLCKQVCLQSDGLKTRNHYGFWAPLNQKLSSCSLAAGRTVVSQGFVPWNSVAGSWSNDGWSGFSLTPVRSEFGIAFAHSWREMELVLPLQDRGSVFRVYELIGLAIAIEFCL